MRSLSLTLAVFLLFSPLAFPSSPLTVTQVADGVTLELSSGEKVRLIGVDIPASGDNAKLPVDVKRTGQDSKAIINMATETEEFTRKLLGVDQAGALSDKAETKDLSQVSTVQGVAYDQSLITALPGNPVVSSDHRAATSVEGRQIRVEYDVQKKDESGRNLAYVHIFVCGPSCSIESVQGQEYSRFEDGTYIFLNATLVKSGYARVMTVAPNVKYQTLLVKLEKEAREQRRGMWG
jgi:endonuclease YncB( thermonuclease family)